MTGETEAHIKPVNITCTSIYLFLEKQVNTISTFLEVKDKNQIYDVLRSVGNSISNRAAERISD